MTTPPTNNEIAGHYVEMWKQTVTVQQHFNDIEWRIRGLALTALTFALGAAAIAAKDGTNFRGVSLGTIVLAVALLLWYAFYFVDRYWYHPLLKGAVKQGEYLEDLIAPIVPGAGLTKTITAASPVKRPFVIWVLGFFAGSRSDDMHSGDKMVWFYRLGAIALVVAAVALQLGTSLNDPGSDAPTPVVVQFDSDTEPHTPGVRVPEPSPETPSNSPAPSISPSPAP